MVQRCTGLVKTRRPFSNPPPLSGDASRVTGATEILIAVRHNLRRDVSCRAVVAVTTVTLRATVYLRHDLPRVHLPTMVLARCRACGVPKTPRAHVGTTSLSSPSFSRRRISGIYARDTRSSCSTTAPRLLLRINRARAPPLSSSCVARQQT